jgi:hypothetical protein
VVAVTFLMAKALLSLSDNNKAEAHTNLDNVVIPNITLAIDEFEFWCATPWVSKYDVTKASCAGWSARVQEHISSVTVTG